MLQVTHPLSARRVPPLRPRAGADPLVSLVVPVFNEEAMVDLFVERTLRALQNHAARLEILFVNDGSTDATLVRLLHLADADPCIRVLNLSRNFGKEAALTAGIDHAKGDVVVPIDVDLQDPPELIPVFLDRWREGYDVAFGVRASRESDSVSKRVTAGLFYRVFNRFSKVQLPENAGDFRLIDRRVADVLRALPEKNRFMKGLFAWSGFPSIGVPYTRATRAAAKTKFSYWRLWNFALDGLLAFSTVPLRIWGYVGAVLAFVAMLYMLFIIARVLLLGIDTPGYASLLSVVLFLGGIQLVTLGILGEYVGRVFTEIKNRPVYVVEGEYSRAAVDANAAPPVRSPFTMTRTDS
jgi:glycosyltransferase involved in cell wall biosynthesis